jgi:hypothetical protein
MKKLVIVCVFLFAFIFLCSSSAMAGGEINNANYTMKYTRDMTPFADPDVIYNPAGLAYEERNFINSGVQVVFKRLGSGIGYDEHMSYAPDTSVHWRKNDRLSFIVGLYNSAGGGTVAYKDGNASSEQLAFQVKDGLNEGLIRQMATVALQERIDIGELDASHIDNEETILSHMRPIRNNIIGVEPTSPVWNTPYGEEFEYNGVTYSDITDYGPYQIATQELEGESMYPTLKVGAVYKVNNRFSISGGFIGIAATKNLIGEVSFSTDNAFIVSDDDDDSSLPNFPIAEDGLSYQNAKLEFEQEAYGITPFLSLNYRLSELCNIAFNYTGPVNLSFRTYMKEDYMYVSSNIVDTDEDGNDDIVGTNTTTMPLNAVKDGSVRETLPAVMSLGFARNHVNDLPIPLIRSIKGIVGFKAGLSYYFQKDGTWDVPIKTGEDTDRQKYFDNAFDIACGASWTPPKTSKFLEPFKFYAGYQFTDPGADINYTSSEKPSIRSTNYSCGLDYKVFDNLIFNFSLLNSEHEDVKRDDGTRLSKEGFVFGAGFEYYF